MVTVTYNIVADSKKELYEALQEHIDNGDIDDWVGSDAQDWDFSAHNLWDGKVDPRTIPIDMGVFDGECINFPSDYKPKRPRIFEELEEHQKAQESRKALGAVQTKLDF